MPYVTDEGNFEEINDQMKRFLIEKAHCEPKGIFSKDSYKRSWKNINILFIIPA